MIAPNDAAILLIVLAIFDGCTAAVMLMLGHYMRENAYRERALVALDLFFAAGAFGLLGASRIGLVDLPPGMTYNLLLLPALLISVPNVIWIAMAATGKFR